MKELVLNVIRGKISYEIKFAFSILFWCVVYGFLKGFAFSDIIVNAFGFFLFYCICKATAETWGSKER